MSRIGMPRRFGARPGGRLLLLAGLLSVLLVPWSGVERLHAAWFRVHVTTLLEIAVPGVRVAAEVVEEPRELQDTEVSLRVDEPAHYHRWGTVVSSRVVGYLPLVLFVALVVATPLTRSRRHLVLVIGVVLLHVLASVRIGLYLVHQGFGLAAAGEGAIGECQGLRARALEWIGSGWVPALVARSSDVLEELMAIHALPVLLWFALTWRHADWRAVLPRAAGGTVEAERA